MKLKKKSTKPKMKLKKKKAQTREPGWPFATRPH